MFGDTPAVAAFLDRLMHHSQLIEIRGRSYRLHESLVVRSTVFDVVEVASNTEELM